MNRYLAFIGDVLICLTKRQIRGRYSVDELGKQCEFYEPENVLKLGTVAKICEAKIN
jgi:hypothetical protein